MVKSEADENVDWWEQKKPIGTLLWLLYFGWTGQASSRWWHVRRNLNTRKKVAMQRSGERTNAEETASTEAQRQGRDWCWRNNRWPWGWGLRGSERCTKWSGRDRQGRAYGVLWTIVQSLSEPESGRSYWMGEKGLIYVLERSFITSWTILCWGQKRRLVCLFVFL